MFQASLYKQTPKDVENNCQNGMHGGRF